MREPIEGQDIPWDAWELKTSHERDPRRRLRRLNPMDPMGGKCERLGTRSAYRKTSLKADREDWGGLLAHFGIP